MKPDYNIKFYYGIRRILKPIFKIVYNPQVKGLENIPTTSFILAGNHTSLLDIPFLITTIERPIRFMSKVENFNNKIVAHIFYKMGAFPVDRDNCAVSTIKKSINIIKDNQILGIFPEGKRNKEKKLLPFKRGIEVLALSTNTVILPFAINGEYKFGKIFLNIGKPINLKEVDIPKKEITEYIRGKVKELL